MKATLQTIHGSFLFMRNRYGVPIRLMLGLLVVLLAAHIALPYFVRYYLNAQLAHMGDYRGHINDIDLALWRGAGRVEGLTFVKIDGQVPVPLLKVPGAELALSWSSLWHDRAIVGRMTLEHPELNFVDGRTEQQSQTGAGVDWRARLEALMPITLNEVHVQDGRVAFRNFQSTPPVNLQATAVNASLYNLSNVRDVQGKRVAHFEGRSQVLGQALLEATADFDPFGTMDELELHLRVTDVELTRLNDFARAYGKFDFVTGSGNLVIEAQVVDGQLHGYVKPLLHNVEVFDWQQDVAQEKKNLFRSLWEAVVGGGQTLLKNQRADQFATRIELSGSLRQREISPLQAFIAILQNAFVQALSPSFERPLIDSDQDEHQ